MPDPKLNILIAYPYFGKGMVEPLRSLGESVRFLLDSGAFTAFKSGKPIRLDDYCRFIDTLPIKPWRYFALDVIGDPVGTSRNYQAMLDRGYRPVPVFTRGGNLDDLDRYFESSDVVGLGGVAGADKASYAWVRAVMQHVGDRKVHILGFTSMDWLKYLKPYSVDSSGWRQPARYGTARVYVGRGQFQSLTRQDVAKLSMSSPILDRIRRFGFDPAELQRKENWRSNACLTEKITAASWCAASLDVARHLGTMLFLATASEAHLPTLIDGYHRAKGALR